VLTVKRDTGKLIVEPTGDPAFELLPVSETSFVRRDSSNKYHFYVGGQNSKDAIKVEVGSNTVEAPRISAEQLVPYELLMAGKKDEALAAYRRIKESTPANVSISQGRLNNLGYSLMRQKRITEAITIFKLNVEFYPKDFDVYDSLGEGYMTNGEKASAIENYKKSLELNPKNTNATEMLKKLEQ
jgi:tetratricopeptide (TPR) repeat protein